MSGANSIWAFVWDGERRGTFVIVVDVVVDVGFPLVVDSDNDIDNDYDGNSRLPSSAAALSDAPICGGIDSDNDCDYDIDLTGRLAHGLGPLPSETCGAKTELASAEAHGSDL